MQNYTEITGSTPMTQSRQLLLDNDKTALSCSEGTAFPTANLVKGMLCLRSDENKLYQLIDPALPSWKLLFDLNKTATNQEYVRQVALLADAPSSTTGLVTMNAGARIGDNQSLALGDGSSYLYGYGDGLTMAANWQIEILSNQNSDGWGDILLDTGGGSIRLSPDGTVNVGGSLQVGGVTFDWIDECEELGFHPDNKHEHEVIAQEIEPVVPDAVAPAGFDRNYLTVRYERLVPLLIEAVKEQQKTIETLQTQVDLLSAKY